MATTAYDEAVEAAAKALWLIVHPGEDDRWANWVDVYGNQSKYHVHARAALRAALPYLLPLLPGASDD